MNIYMATRTHTHTRAQAVVGVLLLCYVDCISHSLFPFLRLSSCVSAWPFPPAVALILAS